MSDWQAVLFFLILWTILLVTASIVLVDEGTIGVVFRFRKFQRVLRPGLRFIIPVIESVEHHVTQTHQHELPDDPEKIDRIHDIPEPGKKLPFRVLQAGKDAALFYVKEKDAGDPSIDPRNPLTKWHTSNFDGLPEDMKEGIVTDSLNEPLTGEIAFVIEWNLEEDDDEKIRQFIKNVSPEEGRNRYEEVRKRMEDMVGRSLQELLGPITLGHARDRMTLFSEVIRMRLEELVGERSRDAVDLRPWGIHINDAYIKSIHPGRRVNEARADAATALSRKIEGIRDAEKEAETIRLKAEADAFAEEQKGIGEAKRIKAMADAMKDENARFLAALDVTETVAKEANLIITSSADGALATSIVAMAKGTTEALKDKK